MEDEFWIVAGVNTTREYCAPNGYVTNERLGNRGMIIMAPKGYMTNDGWDIFVDFLIARISARRLLLGLSPTYWFLLAMDGYGSHTMHPIALRKLFLACILCVCFPSHTSSALQALDVSLFGPTKKYFGSLLATWAWEEQEGATRWDLLIIMHQAVIKAFTISNIKSGFRATGLFPLNLNWCENNSHKLAISTFLRKTAASDESESIPLTWRTSVRASITQFESLVTDHGSRNGRELLNILHRLTSRAPSCLRLFLTVPCRLSSLDLACTSFEQSQRVINYTCATRHKVLMERAVDETFIMPEMTEEKKAKRRGRRNAIDELHSEAKADPLLFTVRNLLLIIQRISKCHPKPGPKPGGPPSSAGRKRRAKGQGRCREERKGACEGYGSGGCRVGASVPQEAGVHEAWFERKHREGDQGLRRGECAGLQEPDQTRQGWEEKQARNVGGTLLLCAGAATCDALGGCQWGTC